MHAKATLKPKMKGRGKPARKDGTKKLTAYDIVASIKKGLAEVELIQQGKLKPTSLKDLLREL